jgi:alpha-L-fucosidase
MAWWRDATFGMFIHWGLYSIPGRGEWVMNRENIPADEYAGLAAQFNPHLYDPRCWAHLARQSGMKYMVLTTKHHDGFCLWDSKLTGFTSVRTAARRDLVREYVDACRAEGLHVGFYFSLMDWHHPDGDGRGLTNPEARTRFVEYVHGQVRELMTHYGRIDILWYDVPWPYDAAGWRATELNAMARALQPHLIINNRSGLPEDFGTPEGHVKAEAAGRDWEACMTLNDNWGFHRGDAHWKTPHEVIRHLATCAHGGGNFLLNVGPDSDGLIPAPCRVVLLQVGEWLMRNGAAIYGGQRANVGWGDFGLMTVKGTTLYLLVDKWAGHDFTLGRVTGNARSARLLATGTPLALRQEGPRLLLSGLPEDAPDSPFSVIAVDFEGEPRHSSGPSTLNRTHAWSDPDVGIV